MAITKNFIQLTPDSGDSYVPEIKLLSKTDFTAYVIDGSFTTSMSAPSMSGSDFEQMKNLAFTQEFKDKSTPIFYFSQSKTFCMNLAPPYFAACFSTPSTAIGLFQPTVVELHKTTGSSVIGEGVYEGNPIYPSLPSMTRGSQNVSTHIQYGSVVSADSSKYGYDLDAKTATKTIPLSSWKYGKLGSDPVTLHITADYVFKFSDYRGKYLSTVALNSQKMSDSESSVCIRSDGSDTKTCTYIPPNSLGTMNTSTYGITATTLSSTINIPSNYIGSPSGSLNFLLTKVMTPQVVSGNKSYIAYTMNMYGLAEIFQVNDTSTSTSLVGDLYVASGIIDSLTLPGGEIWICPARFIAKEADIAGKTSIIKVNSGDGMAFGSQAETYKVKLASTYFVLKSKSGSTTQDNQRNIYKQGKSDGTTIKFSGFLQSLIDANSSPLVDNYSVGIIVLFSGETSEVYALYDDNSIAISSYKLTGKGRQTIFALGIKITDDGKNAVVHKAYLTKTFTGGTRTGRTTESAGTPSDGSFVVAENTGTKKIVALGVVGSLEASGSSSAYYPYYSQDNNGTFLILEPKV